MSQFSQEEKGPDSWHTVRGKFLAVASFTMSCRCLISPIGPSPYCHLGDGTSDLLLIQQCSRIQFLRHLYRCSTTNGNQVTTHVLWCYVDYCTGTCISTIFTLFNYTCFSLFDVVLFFLSVTLLCDGLIVFWVALYYISFELHCFMWLDNCVLSRTVHVIRSCGDDNIYAYWY